MLKELLNISYYPNLQLIKHPFFHKLLTLLKAYGLVFISLLLVAPLILSTDYLVTHVLHFKSIYHSTDVMDRLIRKLGRWQAIVYICLAGPLLEETIFRLPLSLKKTPIVLSISLISFLAGGFILLGMHINDFKIIKLLIFFAVAFALGMWLVPNGLSTHRPRLKKALIIVSMCLFGLIHISNYSPIQWGVIWLYPVFVLPQLAMGWAITYIRFKNGFFWGFALHCLINSVSVLLAFAH